MNADLAEKIKQAGTKREKAVAAANFLVNITHAVPYAYETWGHSPGRYTEKGLFFSDMRVGNETVASWGCGVSKPSSPVDDAFIGISNLGNHYANGLHCSSFIGWCFFNAGVAGKERLNKKLADQYDSFPLCEKVSLKEAKDEIKEGDLLWFPGHVAMVIGVKGDMVKIAESAIWNGNHLDSDNGVRWRIFDRKKENYNSFRFKYLIKMEGT